MVNFYFDLPPKCYEILQNIVHRGHGRLGKILRDAYISHKPGVALELGCGTGILSKFFVPNEYVGCDIDEARIESARKNHPSFVFFIDDATKLKPEFVARFSFIFCHAWVHHIDDSSTSCILKRVAEGGREAGHTIEMLIVEPVLPERPLANPFGYILAKLDRGRFVRHDKAMRSLFEPYLRKAYIINGPWYWPVPSGVYYLSFEYNFLS